MNCHPTFERIACAFVLLLASTVVAAQQDGCDWGVHMIPKEHLGAKYVIERQVVDDNGASSTITLPVRGVTSATAWRTQCSIPLDVVKHPRPQCEQRDIIQPGDEARISKPWYSSRYRLELLDEQGNERLSLRLRKPDAHSDAYLRGSSEKGDFAGLDFYVYIVDIDIFNSAIPKMVLVDIFDRNAAKNELCEAERLENSLRPASREATPLLATIPGLATATKAEGEIDIGILFELVLEFLLELLQTNTGGGYEPPE